jgi:hypothetical protein
MLVSGGKLDFPLTNERLPRYCSIFSLGGIFGPSVPVIALMTYARARRIMTDISFRGRKLEIM